MTRINNSTSLRFLRMHNKKFSEEYIYKLCTLLYSNDKEHKLKRKYLNQLEYSCDANSNMCLTGLKSIKTDDRETKSNSKGRNRLVKAPIQGLNNKDESGVSLAKNISIILKNNEEINNTSRQHDQRLFNLIPEFKNKQTLLKEESNFIQINTSMDEEENDENTNRNKKEIEIEIFNKLQTRPKFYKQKKYSSINNSSSNNTNQNTKGNKKDYLILPELNTKSAKEGLDDITYNINKIFQKAKILREANSQIHKMNLINLFSYKRSKWNHYTIFPEQNKNRSVTKRYKEKLKEPLPNFKELEKQRRSKSTQHLRSENTDENTKNMSEEELQKLENEKMEKQRQLRKLMKEKEELTEKEKETENKKKMLSKEETMDKIKNEIRLLNNLVKECEDEDYIYKIINQKRLKGPRLSRKKSSFITANAIFGSKMSSNITAETPVVKEEMNLLYRNPFIKKN